MKKSNILFVAVLLIAIVMAIFLNMKQDEDKIKTMSEHKSLVEQSYVDGGFSLKHVEIEEGTTYKMYAEGNKIITKYNYLAQNGKKLTEIVLEARIDQNSNFVWTCYKDALFMKLKCGD